MSARKTDNIHCNLCLSDNNATAKPETDKSWLLTEKNLKTYPRIIYCGECFKDEDEDSCFYHPKCFENKHLGPVMTEKKIQRHLASQIEIDSGEFMRLSSAEKEVFVKKPTVTLFERTLDRAGVIGGALAVPYFATVSVAGIKCGSVSVGVNMVDEIAALAGEGVTKGGIAMSGVANLAVFGWEIGQLYKSWSRGTIGTRDLKVGAIKAAVGNLSSFSSASIGAWIGSMILPGGGTIIGGLIGAIVGGVANHYSRKGVQYLTRSSFYSEEEDERRAEVIVEAFYFLDLPACHLITESVVGSKFRKAALQCHPDMARVRALTSEEEKAKAKLEFDLLRHAKDTALGFLQYQDSFSARCQEMIAEKYNPDNKENMTFEKLKSTLDKTRHGGSLTKE